jgi:hypothetical protein
MASNFKLSFNPFTSGFDYAPVDMDFSILRDVQCEAGTVVGDAVRMSSGIAIRAIANSVTNSNIIGIVEDITDAGIASIRIGGLTSEIYTNLEENKDYYLSDSNPGKLTTIPPSNSGSIILRVGQAFSLTKLIVSKGLSLVLA